MNCSSFSCLVSGLWINSKYYFCKWSNPPVILSLWTRTYLKTFFICPLYVSLSSSHTLSIVGLKSLSTLLTPGSFAGTLSVAGSGLSTLASSFLASPPSAPSSSRFLRSSSSSAAFLILSASAISASSSFVLILAFIASSRALLASSTPSTIF